MPYAPCARSKYTIILPQISDHQPITMIYNHSISFHHHAINTWISQYMVCNKYPINIAQCRGKSQHSQTFQASEFLWFTNVTNIAWIITWISHIHYFETSLLIVKFGSVTSFDVVVCLFWWQKCHTSRSWFCFGVWSNPNICCVYVWYFLPSLI